jgi:hypothetical protein
MAPVCKHANALLHIAMIPEPGSHVEPAWLVMRPKFEAAVTAAWLVDPDDPQVLKERLLMYYSGELEYLGRMLRGEDVANPDSPPQAQSRMASVERSLRALASWEGKDKARRKPPCREMMRQCGIPDKHYREFYSIASHRIHGGSTVLYDWFEGLIRKGGESNYSAWNTPIAGASWSLANPGAVVLKRHGAPERMVRAIRDLGTELSEHLAICDPPDAATE